MTTLKPSMEASGVMSRALVIVESPAKAKTINKFLGEEYVVKASIGHVLDLPKKELGVDIENSFQPRYIEIADKKKVIEELRDEAEKVDKVYLAPDPDREGEAIAWHLFTLLKGKVPDEEFYRVTYNEITADAIRAAFAHPGRIDSNKVDAQQARRILDRIVGYQVSPLLWRRIKGGSSAGRVQSVALRLVCEREQLIADFVPEEYWLLGAMVSKQIEPKDLFTIRLAKIAGEKAEIKNEQAAVAIRDDLEKRQLRVSAVIRREIKKKPRPPYITSTLQQAASSAFGFTPSRTMRIAQKLYEGIDFGEGPTGLITYMRTDSVAISAEAGRACRAYIEKTYGTEYLPEKPPSYSSRSNAQEAHEAIRPTDVNRPPDELTSTLEAEELKLYSIIWQRFVASQMAHAKIAQRTAEVEALSPDEGATTYLFRATTSEVVFPGYLKVIGEEANEKDNKKSSNEDEVEKLPPLEKGEPLDCREWLLDRKETKPPARYTEASLVRAMEKNGVGRPSTYAQIISTLYNRKYIVKEKRSLVPNDTGKEVCGFLVSHLAELFDVGFTAEMEGSLDGVEKGAVKWTGMLKEFYDKLSGWLDQARDPGADPETLNQLLELMESVKEWAPPTKRGKKTYSDERFVKSLRKQLQEGKKLISSRQLEALKKLTCRYRKQLPEIGARAAELGIEEELREASRPPREETVRKLVLLQDVQFNEPRTVGKKTYDDQAFSQSLREQVDRGKRLSEKQVKYLDRLLIKYAKQFEDFDKLAAELGLKAAEAEEDLISGPLLELAKNIKEWKPPFKRGRREWDDRKFFESLSEQYAAKGRLSPKQIKVLKNMLKRYAAQVPDYDQLIEKFDLRPKGKSQTNSSAGGGSASG